MKRFKEFLEEGVSQKTPEKILKFASSFKSKDNAESALKNYVKKENYEIVFDKTKENYLIVTRKEKGILLQDSNFKEA